MRGGALSFACLGRFVRYDLSIRQLCRVTTTLHMRLVRAAQTCWVTTHLRPRLVRANLETMPPLCGRWPEPFGPVEGVCHESQRCSPGDGLRTSVSTCAGQKAAGICCPNPCMRGHSLALGQREEVSRPSQAVRRRHRLEGRGSPRLARSPLAEVRCAHETQTECRTGRGTRTRK